MCCASFDTSNSKANQAAHFSELYDKFDLEGHFQCQSIRLIHGVVISVDCCAPFSTSNTVFE